MLSASSVPILARSAVARDAFAPAVSTTVPRLIILGTDALLTATPATPVQIAHACMAAGFHAVIPASWGDELIAARTVERLRNASAPLVHCSCPYVSRRLTAGGNALETMVLSLIAPPIATAHYLRALYAPTQPHITYAGSCPSALHDSIDVWLAPDELMSAFTERGISASTQPTEFDSVLPPDRRRYYSEPGGLPSRHVLRHLPMPVELVELKTPDFVVDLAQHLLSSSRALIDVSLPLGCCCSGASGGVAADAARARVREHEPPRAPSPVVDHSVSIVIDSTPSDGSSSSRRETPAQVVEPPATTREITPEPALISVETTPRRRSPAGLARPVLGAMPLRRAEAGRQLPRAYVARRRSSPKGMRQSSLRTEEPASAHDEVRGKRWIWIAATGVAIGIGIALLLRAVL